MAAVAAPARRDGAGRRRGRERGLRHARPGAAPGAGGGAGGARRRRGASSPTRRTGAVLEELVAYYLSPYWPDRSIERFVAVCSGADRRARPPPARPRRERRHRHLSARADPPRANPHSGCRWGSLSFPGADLEGGGQRQAECQGSPGPQPAGCGRGDPEGLARRVHRAVGQREVVARVRHDLRRGAAPLRRVAVRLRAPVPRPGRPARRRLHRGALARGVDRPEVDEPQPPLDGRHDHRGLGLHAPALGAHRGAALPDLPRAHREPDGAADRRPADGARGGHPLPGRQPGRAAEEGRVRRTSSRSCRRRATAAPSSTARRCSSPRRSR